MKNTLAAPHTVRIGRTSFPFTTYADVSAAYREVIDELGLGVSQTPNCVIVDGAGKLVARAAYNGRVFGVLPNGEYDPSNVLHETRSAADIARLGG